MKSVKERLAPLVADITASKVLIKFEHEGMFYICDGVRVLRTREKLDGVDYSQEPSKMVLDLFKADRYDTMRIQAPPASVIKKVAHTLLAKKPVDVAFCGIPGCLVNAEYLAAALSALDAQYVYIGGSYRDPVLVYLYDDPECADCMAIMPRTASIDKCFGFWATSYPAYQLPEDDYL